MAHFAGFLFQLQDGSTEGSSALGAGMGIGFAILWLALVVLFVASMWKIFEKAGEPGWAALIPIYNIIVLIKIAGKPLWWFVLMLIPIVNFIVAVILTLAVAKNFGKGTGYAMGMLFLAPVFYPMLAFGDSRYQPQP
jgi:hypothetical protein